MLTIVYCAEKRNQLVEENWVSTSGLQEVEILHFPSLSFAQGYNQGLKKAKFDCVVFLREDVVLMSKDWGIKALDWHRKAEWGILGVVGSIIVPMSGMVWEKEEPLVGRIWYEEFDAQHESRFSEVFKDRAIPVVTVDDAMLLVNRKKLVATFDESYVSDSFYDMDFCLGNYEKGVKIGVMFDIKVLKLDLNDQDEAWQINRRMFVNKHRNLPFRLKPEIIMTNVPVKIPHAPKVSLLISSKGNPVEVASCLESIYEKSKYSNLDIYVIDLGSEASELQSVREFIKGHKNTQLIEMQHGHMPSIYEEVIESKLSPETELLLFCDSAVILLNDAISKMVKVYLEDPKNCGTLGIRMHTKNNMVRHFGLQLFSTATEEGYELGLGYSGFQSAYKYQNKVVKNVLGASKDFLMVSYKLFRELGGFNKEYLHSLEDFELNLKTILAGRKNFLVGNAVCYYLGVEIPKFLPTDFERLVNFVNDNVEVITPYVDLMYAA